MFPKPHEVRTPKSQPHMSTSPPALVSTSDSKMAIMEGPFDGISPELPAQETDDNESGSGSPKNLSSACVASGFRWENSAIMQQQTVRVQPSPPPQALYPKQVPAMPTYVTPASEVKSSPLSNEMVKIFTNLGLDTAAILDLLASQGKLHICRSCNIVFPEYSTFVLHRGCHGTVGPFQCHFCQVRFPEKFGFLTHFMQCPHK